MRFSLFVAHDIYLANQDAHEHFKWNQHNFNLNFSQCLFFFLQENLVFDYCGDLKSFFSVKFTPPDVNHWSLIGLSCEAELKSHPVLYEDKSM